MTDLFDDTHPVILEDDRVLLRLLQRADYSHLLPFSLHEPELWKYALVSGEGEEGLQHYINIAVQEYELKREFPFIVFDKRKNAYAGSTRFYDINLPFQNHSAGIYMVWKSIPGNRVK